MIRLVALMLLADGAGAFAQTAPVRLTPPEIDSLAQLGPGAGTSGVPGTQSIVLSGDPAKPGPYTIEIRVPARTRIAPHAHRDDRSAVVISGDWYLAYGERPEPAGFKLLPAGSFYTEPAGAPHYAMTGERPAVVYISGFGPTSTDHVEAASAPRR